jgi:hypothetical protein
MSPNKRPRHCAKPFPPPPQADPPDIEGLAYPPPIECPDMTIPEIKKAVCRMSPNKAPGTDGIINGILHLKNMHRYDFVAILSGHVLCLNSTIP